MDQKQNLGTFTCVDYPGLVKNEKEAIRTLGGMDRLNQAFSRRNSKLLLNFTPDNIFSKTLCSSQISDPSSAEHSDTNTSKNNDQQNEANYFREPTSNITTLSKQNDLISMPCLLMSVRKNKSSNTLKIEVIGKIKKVFNFQKMADFQYLPMSCQTTKTQNQQSKFSYTAFYDTFLFNNINNYDYELRKNTLPQLFILPPFFSRFDDPVNYAYRSEPTKKHVNQIKDIVASTTTENEPQISVENDANSPQKPCENSNELIRSMRQERSSQALLVSFGSKEIPMKPSEKLKPARTELIRECVAKLRELFNERPCYLKSVLLCITNYTASLLKETLPYVAYYFSTGPWRSCWVRYGYDPRSNPDARVYQMIDYRLRNNAEPEHIVKSKPRSSYHKRKFTSDLNESEIEDYKTFKLEDEMYKFKPDKLPGSRNVFYQICDIEDEDVQKLIMSNENHTTKCNEKDGWCMANIQDKCRNIMSQKHEQLSKVLSNENKEGKKSTKN